MTIKELKKILERFEDDLDVEIVWDNDEAGISNINHKIIPVAITGEEEDIEVIQIVAE